MSIIRKKPNILNRSRNKESTEVEKAEIIQGKYSTDQLGRKINVKCPLCDQKFRTRPEIRTHIERFHIPKTTVFPNEDYVQGTLGSLEPINFENNSIDPLINLEEGTILTPLNFENSENDISGPIVIDSTGSSEPINSREDQTESISFEKSNVFPNLVNTENSQNNISMQSIKLKDALGTGKVAAKKFTIDCEFCFKSYKSQKCFYKHVQKQHKIDVFNKYMYQEDVKCESPGNTEQFRAKQKEDLNLRQKIIEECVDKFISPSVLALIYQIKADTIRRWIFNAGKTLPKSYVVRLSNYRKKKFKDLLNIQGMKDLIQNLKFQEQLDFDKVLEYNVEDVKKEPLDRYEEKIISPNVKTKSNTGGSKDIFQARNEDKFEKNGLKSESKQMFCVSIEKEFHSIIEEPRNIEDDSMEENNFEAMDTNDITIKDEPFESFTENNDEVFDSVKNNLKSIEVIKPSIAIKEESDSDICSESTFETDLNEGNS